MGMGVGVSMSLCVGVHARVCTVRLCADLELLVCHIWPFLQILRQFHYNTANGIGEGGEAPHHLGHGLLSSLAHLEA